MIEGYITNDHMHDIMSLAIPFRSVVLKSGCTLESPGKHFSHAIP